MEKFEFSSTRELKPLTDSYFTKDTISDGDTVALSSTDVIWSMSQNVEVLNKRAENQAKEKPNYPLLLSIIAYMAVRNPAGTIQTLAKYTKVKFQHMFNAMPEHVYNGIVSTAHPAPSFPTPSVIFIHSIKSTTPESLPPQP
jgi:hypothetical protein